MPPTVSSPRLTLTVLLLNVVLGSIGATNCGLLLAGTAVMAVPFLLRS